MWNLDLDAVARRSFEQFLDVGLTRRRCGFSVVGKWLPHLEEHLLQSGWSDGYQQSCRLLALALKAVQTADRHVQKRAFPCDDSIFAQLAPPANLVVETNLFQLKSFIDRGIYYVEEALVIGAVLVVIVLFLLNIRTTFIMLMSLLIRVVVPVCVILAVSEISRVAPDSKNGFEFTCRSVN